ncbi:hypothetical protein I215_06277 [Galbibacter marinus]|uniref:GAF domain-containing protein n=1 Tax=Galbibacter marinus TaxID=555500 RepID=K2PVL3_9FLAO|nr:hypothetical protein [Galbibacter marinus]EKF55544.1 hypothetical protein I215_06277 [Galbibacter marinus]
MTKEAPFEVLISFHKLLDKYESLAQSKNKLQAKKAKEILELAGSHSELRNGIVDRSRVGEFQEIIDAMLQDSFSSILSENEIKIAGIPFEYANFQTTQRFDKIIEDAGKDFFLHMRDLPDGQMYVLQCAIILTMYYKIDINFKRTLYFDIPDKYGIMRHYRIMYNADFMDFIPTDKAKDLTQEDIEELLDGFDNLELWKEKFPPNSWIAKGFVISSLFDTTLDHSISNLKTTLLERSSGDLHLIQRLQNIFRSFFNIRDLEVGFSIYDNRNFTFERLTSGLPSFLLCDLKEMDCKTLLCQQSREVLLKDKRYLAISDVEKKTAMQCGDMPYKVLNDQGLKSAILIPINTGEKLVGVLELVSKKSYELNSINAKKLDDILPYITAAVVRSNNELENEIEAIIQNEYTSIHESVKWKFVKEVKRFIDERAIGNNMAFKDITFKEVQPLYGQVDIQNSSTSRNKATQRDLAKQLELLGEIFSTLMSIHRIPIYEEYQFRVFNFLEEVKKSFKTGTEQRIIDFINEEIHPSLDQIALMDPSLDVLVSGYRDHLDTNLQMVYDHRQNYDDAVTAVNKRLTRVIDQHQKDAQLMFPHYFERYKTDGVEHTMYIGESITPGAGYSDLYLQNLKLWQLETICAMENAFYELKPELEVDFEVTSMVLVHSSPLSIKFRMDEKHFDVDGTYNARYEVIKKRIDKSLIKGTNRRITQPGKIAIIYSQEKEELEYLRYIRLLQAKGMLNDKIEIHELEELQGVSGLKAISVEILYSNEANEKSKLTYDDLVKSMA